jgi:hypothetical protein
MKLTKSKLKQIIKEELEDVLKEKNLRESWWNGTSAPKKTPQYMKAIAEKHAISAVTEENATAPSSQKLALPLQVIKSDPIRWGDPNSYDKDDWDTSLHHTYEILVTIRDAAGKSYIAFMLVDGNTGEAEYEGEGYKGWLKNSQAYEAWWPDN